MGGRRPALDSDSKFGMGNVARQRLLAEQAVKEIELPPRPWVVRRTPPERVAEAIVKAAGRPQPEVYVTWFDRLAVGLKAVSPRLVDWALRQFHTKGRRGKR